MIVSVQISLDFCTANDEDMHFVHEARMPHPPSVGLTLDFGGENHYKLDSVVYTPQTMEYRARTHLTYLRGYIRDLERDIRDCKEDGVDPPKRSSPDEVTQTWIKRFLNDGFWSGDDETFKLVNHYLALEV